MHWLRKNRRKIGLALAGASLLLVLVAWLPVSTVDAHVDALGSALPGTIVVQATPTEDATVTALNKEKLEQEVQQLKEQNEPDLFEWLRTNGAILLSTLVVVIGGLIGFFRWLGDRRSEREKRAEERFQSAVTGLGNEREEAKIGAAILLRTFLRPGYEQFYTQTFDLAVAHLRLPRTPNSPEDPNAPLPLTTLRQALIVVFKEAFPLARDSLLKEQGTQFRSQSLDASGIQLDIAYLRWADLEQVRMPHASLRGVELRGANLSRADLWGADLSRVRDLEEVQSLDHTDLRRVIGLTKEQLEACKAKGAIIDEDSSVSSSQSTISPLQPSQDKSAPDQELTPDQGSMPTADTGGSTAASSKLSSES